MKSINKQLGLASCALLSQSANALQAVDNAWEIDSTLLHYAETDRISVSKAVATVKGVISDDDSVVLKTVYDTMSGSTPSGAVKSTNLTFTGASGGGVDASGQASALAEFDDTRVGLSIDWDHALSRQQSFIFNGAVSVENDYRSFSFGSTFKREAANKNFTLTMGLAGTYDQVFRVGDNDTPEQLSVVSDQLSLDEGEKTTIDAIIGLTYVINRRTVAQLNLGSSLSQGYMTDPYKVVSIVDAAGNEYEQYYEKRPGSRHRYTLKLNLNHQLFPENTILNSSFRYFTDDWGISAETFELSLQKQLSDRWYFKPNLRLYHQTAADFYQNSFFDDPTDALPVANALPEFLSADYRLDQITGFTLGSTFGLRSTERTHLRLRALYIHQSFDQSEFSTLNSFVLQVSYGKKF